MQLLSSSMSSRALTIEDEDGDLDSEIRQGILGRRRIQLLDVDGDWGRSQ